MSETFDYAEARADANELIAEFGQAGAIRRTERGSDDLYDPDGGTITTTDHPCTLVVIDYTLRERESSLIEANDRKVLIAAEGLAVEPQEEDALVIGGEAFNIASVMPLTPGGTVVLYEVQARS